MRTYRIRQIAALAATVALIGCSTGSPTKNGGAKTSKTPPAAGDQTSSRTLRKKPTSMAPRSTPTRPAVAPKAN